MQDQKSEADNNILFIEYLASFWNPEAVSKIKEARDSKSNHNFKNDDEFEEEVLSKSFKDNKYVDAIRKLREAEGKDSLRNINKPKSKQAINLDAIHSTIKKFK